MLPFTFRMNAGMIAACALLVAGALVVLYGGPERQTLGTGILVLAAAVYFVARVKQLVDGRRQDP